MKRKGSIFALSTVFLSLLAGTGWADDALTSEDRQDVKLKSPVAEQTVTVSRDFGKLPLYFIKNMGQLEKDVRYFEKGSGHATYFTNEGVYLNLTRRVAEDRSKPSSGEAFEVEKFDAKSELIKLSLSGSSKNPEIISVDALDGKINYFVGGDRSKWKTSIPTYGGILYKEVYKGIDIKYYGNNTQLEYDVIVKPGADYRNVKFAYEGIKGLRVLDNGDLEITLKEGVIHQKKPYIYQEIDGKRKEVDGRFKVLSKKGAFAYGFEVASYDKKRELVIDPYLVYSTYLGGSGYDFGTGIAVDPSGNAYVAGITASINFPTVSPLQASKSVSSDSNDYDMFVTKLNATGTAIIYSTYLGGSSYEEAPGIAVDFWGNSYIAGTTGSADFPMASPLQGTLNGDVDAFVTKLDASGGLVYSTYLGGSATEYDTKIAVDTSGNAYIAGTTYSADFPTAFPLLAAHNGTETDGCGEDAFVAKINPTGTALVYSTYLGGSYCERSYGIDIDPSGNAYVTGTTTSTDFPTASPLQAELASDGFDAFVTKIDPTGTTLVYSTYIGGSDMEEASDIAADASGNAYITGTTLSVDFPTASPYQGAFTLGGYHEAFVTKINASGTAFVYSTFLGGNSADIGLGIAADSSGNAYVTGLASSINFPTSPSAFQPSPLSMWCTNGLCAGTGFITKFDETGNLTYSTYFGARYVQSIFRDIAVDKTGNAYMTGSVSGGTNSRYNDFPKLYPIQETFGGGGWDAFAVKMSFNILPSLSYPSELGYGDSLEPNAGTASTVFTYKAIYTDENNNAPSYMRVCVDGACNAMSADNGAAVALNDGDYTNGEQYAYSTALGIGSHDYYFEASDDTGSVRLPSSGSLSGPTVSDLAISTTALPEGIVGYAYSQTLAATGGVAPYTWSLPSGGLPAGLSLDPATGEISGTPESAGIYGFAARVTDSTGVYETVSLTTVISVDTAAPVITVPSGMSVNATSPAGAVVTYTASVTDDIDQSPSMNCAPASGSTFPIAINAVTCTASDWVGNSSTAEFSVTVLGPSELITKLIGVVESYNLKQGIVSSFDAKLENAQKALAAAGGGDSAGACNMIDAFINEVDAQSGKSITTTQAVDLIRMATNIKNAQACQ